MVDRDEYLFNNDPHIAALWTERYQQIKRQEKTDQYAEYYDRSKTDAVGFNKCLVRQFPNTSNTGYEIFLDYGRGQTENIRLNKRFFTSDFNRWHDNLVTEMRLDRSNYFQGWRVTKYSSEDGKWQLAVTLNNAGKWVHGYIVFKNRFACERVVANTAKSGELGSWKTAYREVGFNKFEEI